MTSRRRLLTIAHSYCVGVNRRLAHEFAAQGWDVTAVAPARYRGDFRWHEVESGPDGGCRLEAVPVRPTRAPHFALYGRRLRALMREPWDLVHCWEEPYVAAAAQVAALAPPRVPLVFATFQNIAKRYPPPLNWFERFTLARADGVVAFAQTALAVLLERGFPADAARVIPPGVDTEAFRPDAAARAEVRAGLGWDEAAPVVGFLGRFVEAKGLRLLMSVLDAVAMPWRALLVGSGPLEGEMRAWAARYGDRIHIRTGVGHDDVPRWLNAMDVLCAPSQTTAAWREQFGRMLIEAAGCGVPVIASASGEIPHVLGDAGVLVGEQDGAEWTAALQALLASPDRRRGLARLGRQRVESRYSWTVVGREHAAFFDDLIARRVSGRRAA